LLLALVGLVTCGFLVAGAVTYDALQNFLGQRVDQQLPAALHVVASTLSQRPPFGGDVRLTRHSPREPMVRCSPRAVR
jgi:hypothetical protein